MSAQMHTKLTRRHFTTLAVATVAASRLPAQDSAHANVAAMERDRILFAAPAALLAQPRTLLDASTAISTLTAAHLLTKEARYADRASALLTTWLVTPATRINTHPTLDRSHIVDLLPLAELARSTSFLTDALPTETLTPINTALTEILSWLNTNPEALIARDTKDHRASAWLLLTAALARSQRDDRTLDQCRHRLRTPTLRNQIDEFGRFPQEMATPNPFRNTLFNFDLLCGACQLLDTSANSISSQLWSYELGDGVGIRSVVAFLYPIIADPAQWPGVSDAEYFRDLPGRRPGLLFAGRAYGRPEYVELWRTTSPAIAPGLAATFPIRQPLLWITRAPHGL